MAPLHRRALNRDVLCLPRAVSDPSRLRPANDRGTSRNDENGRSIESAGQVLDSRIVAGSEIGPENTLKVEARVRIPLGLPGETRHPRSRLHPGQGAAADLQTTPQINQAKQDGPPVSRPAFVPQATSRRHGMCST
jgi:hypothetical protein